MTLEYVHRFRVIPQTNHKFPINTLPLLLILGKPIKKEITKETQAPLAISTFCTEWVFCLQDLSPFKIVYENLLATVASLVLNP